MTRQEAIAFDNELKYKLMEAGNKYGLGKEMGADIVDNYIIVMPDEERKGMIFLGNESASYKGGNIKLDFKKAIVAGMELTASINMPESVFSYIQLLIVGAFFIQKSTKEELNNLEAYIVYFLHIRDAYTIGIQEEQFMDEFQSWYWEQEGKALELKEITEAVNHLYRIQTVDIVEGIIYLKEYVIWKVK